MAFEFRDNEFGECEIYDNGRFTGCTLAPSSRRSGVYYVRRNDRNDQNVFEWYIQHRETLRQECSMNIPSGCLLDLD